MRPHHLCTRSDSGSDRIWNSNFKQNTAYLHHKKWTKQLLNQQNKQDMLAQSCPTFFDYILNTSAATNSDVNTSLLHCGLFTMFNQWAHFNFWRTTICVAVNCSWRLLGPFSCHLIAKNCHIAPQIKSNKYLLSALQ